MTAFGSGVVSLPAATATKVADAEEFNRAVVLSGSVHFAFTSASASTGIQTNETQPSNASVASFVLPADQELWAYSSGATSVSYLITATA